MTDQQALVADRTATLMFLLFICIADADAGLTAREVQALNAMLAAPGWTNDDFLKRGQDRLRERYFDLWQTYQKGQITRDVASVAGQLALLTAAPGAPTGVEIAALLETFLDHLSGKAQPILTRLGMAATAPAKRRARADVDLLLGQAGEERVATPPPAEPAAAVPKREIDLAVWPAAYLAASPENIWSRGRIAVRCVAVIPETADVQTFVLVAARPVLFVYQPGQFVTLELPIDGKTVRRSYTLSSSPSRPWSISITVKRTPQGLVSNWLHDNMNVGFECNLSGPHGSFTCFNAPAEKLLLIAAGSGITPIMSMLRWIVDTASVADIVLLNNIRTPADVIFENELAYLGTRMGERLKVGVIAGKYNAGYAWNGPSAHFSEQLIRLWAPDFAEREVFVCGPSGYMQAVRTTLERIGLPMAQYHEESFGTPALAMIVPVALQPAPVAATPLPALVPPPASAVAPDVVEIVFAKSGKTVGVSAGDYLLDVAEEHGVEIESGCRSGNCGTCKLIKTSGEVVMEAQTALSEADIADGYVLACVGRAYGKRVVVQA